MNKQYAADAPRRTLMDAIAHHEKTNGATMGQNSVREKTEIEREIDSLDQQVTNAQGRLIELANRLTSVSAAKMDVAKTGCQPRAILHSPLGNTLAQLSDRVGALNESICSLMDRIKL